ncbi:hypothetical protein JVU11DRAFT_10366 [Chiua virens]|nr:hypothetical protein JVU11DRAFT_10366 [Chiua virens]
MENRSLSRGSRGEQRNGEGEGIFEKIGKHNTHGYQESNESSASRKKEVKPIEIDARDMIVCILFIADGRHILSGGLEKKIRRWRGEDGREVGAPMEVGSHVYSIAVSPDGKWVVSGTHKGQITVWNAESGEKATEFRGHYDEVNAVDISPDGTKIVSGSPDKTACIWSLATGQLLIGPLQHDHFVVAAKFAPNGHLIATATSERNSVRAYATLNGRLLVDFPIQVNSAVNGSLAWADDSRQVFALSQDGNINSLDIFTGTTLARWHIHSSSKPKCIALASNGTFIAASADSSVSFWDTTTHRQIGPLLKHNDTVRSMAISTNYKIVIGGGKTLTLRSLSGILPGSPYTDNKDIQHKSTEKADLEQKIQSLRARDKLSNDKIASLEKTIQRLRGEVVDAQRAASKEKDSRDETIKSLRADLSAQEASSSNLKKTAEELCTQLADAAKQEADTLNEIIQSLRTKDKNSDATIARLEQKVDELRARCADSQHNNSVVQQLRAQLTDSQKKVDGLTRLLRIHELKHQCEALYVKGRMGETAKSLLKIKTNMNEDINSNKMIVDWISEFTSRCIATLEKIGDKASKDEKHDEALAAYSTALSLGSSTPDELLIKWAITMLLRNSTDDVVLAAAQFTLPRITNYRAICDALESSGRITEAMACFRQMKSALAGDTSIHDEKQSRWEADFRERCIEKLVELGDIAMDSKKHDEAIGYYSSARSLDPENLKEILVKRSKGLAMVVSWERALSDADEAIQLDPSSYRGHERRHAALHGMRRYSEAVEAFDTMLLKFNESPDEHIRKLGEKYFDARPVIRRFVDQMIHRMPRILIDTATGRLKVKEQQADAFETLPIYHELVSSMTTEADHSRIWKEVKEFYRYVMLSHTWESGEPLLQKVGHTSVYELEASPANIKLQMFCSHVRSLGFRWAWSDTCCVDKDNNVVLQESLVAMFTWYRGSSLTIVYLRGVPSQSQKPGDLRGSLWNTRGWTYQEYVAAETVQFYTEDWKPYLGLSLSNHKESDHIGTEMEQVSQLAILRPGLDRVREKLFRASKRRTTYVEDIAYSLLGIFHVSIPVIYGEGNRAVGRLLEHILTGSGDVTILAWTGSVGSYNSCLPMDLTVYDQLEPPHIPRLIDMTQAAQTVTKLRSSLADLSLATTLYDRLNELPIPSVAASRLQLPGIIFPLTDLVDISDLAPATHLRSYRAMSPTFGDIQIKTVDDLTGTKDLYLVHPWIRPLLDQEFSAEGAGELDKTARALRFVARLQQPFGALLFEPLSRIEYRRVATDSLIIVRMHEEVRLDELLDKIRTIAVQ